MSMSKPFEENRLQNASSVIKNSNISSSPLAPGTNRTAPILPPRPSSLIANSFGGCVNNYMPYGGGYGSYNSFNSYSMPYRSPYSSFGSYGGYGSFNNYGALSGFGQDDHERRFIQYAEESSRNTFASVESIVRAFNSLAMMLDNTFFAMTSSFRAVLSVAENFGRLRTMFGQIWYSVNIFRFLNWLYKRLLRLVGFKVADSTASAAWKQATENGAGMSGPPPSGGSSWPTLAFLGMLVSAPYIISKFLPKYEDKGNPANWKSPGIRAKAAFDFIATTANELTIRTNELVLLAPTYIQEEMNLKNSGWAYAVCNGKAGVVPLNYLVISKNRPILSKPSEELPIPRQSKRVSFGKTQVFENIDIDDYDQKKEESKEDKNKKRDAEENPSEKLTDCNGNNSNNVNNCS